jgi:hypothetical protein
MQKPILFDISFFGQLPVRIALNLKGVEHEKVPVISSTGARHSEYGSGIRRLSPC